MRIRLITTASLLVLLPFSAPSAQTGTNDNLAGTIAAHLKPFVDNRDFSVVVLVARGDEILFKQAYGRADYEWDVPMPLDARFCIASLTKTFTSGAILSLAAEGKIDLQATVDRYLPSFPHGDKIQVRHLLLHMSGLSDLYQLPDADTIFLRRWTLEELVTKIGNAPLQYEPGTDGAYNSAGYVVLARIIEVASGRSYEDFLRRRFFNPLGMGSTGINYSEEVVPGRVSAYVPGPPPEGLHRAEWLDVSVAVGSGALSSTAEDLLAWGRAVRQRRFFDLFVQEYPYGWGRREQAGRKFIEQTGLFGGYMSILQVFPDDGTIIVVLGNITSVSFSKLQNDIVGIVLGETPEPYAPPAAARIEAAEAQRLLGCYQYQDWTFRITMNEGFLYYQRESGGSPVYLTPVSSSHLFIRMENTHLRFEADDAGRIVAVQFDSPWNSERCPKIE